MGSERDWSTLRSRDWEDGKTASNARLKASPKSRWVPKSAAADGRSSGGTPISGTAWLDGATSSLRSGDADIPPGYEGTTPSFASDSKSFATDADITVGRGKSQNEEKKPRERELVKWDPRAWSEGVVPAQGGLETSVRGGKKNLEKNWDQFKVNYELFGVVSTFKNDLSQYTTPLNKSEVPLSRREEAERIARSIESQSGRHCQLDEEAARSGSEDEEALFASVPRAQGKGYKASTRQAESREAAEGAGASSLGGALLSVLRAGPVVRSDGDYRSKLTATLQEWWEAQRCAGRAVPAGAASGLVCPFTELVFGDVSQLVMHWTAVLPEVAEDTKEREDGAAASSMVMQLRLAASSMRWSELAALIGQSDHLSLEKPRTGSVWEKVVERLHGGKKPANESNDAEDVTCLKILMATLAIKCWRRDQKVEHREVLEGIAAGLVLHIFSEGASDARHGDSTAWKAAAGHSQRAPAVGVCH
eukprot:TRINITY_DN29645_c0_g1_i1.p1 TRINITY_DN29645_c0_g1~~TRINITY_DN29645_c0_g1_i1.p1  ORF type:complete len:484 (+),score=97.66 TRINITY_DN29645_c0_g1_i1:22-1452(+)